MVSKKQYLRSEILNDLIYVPVFIGVFWAGMKVNDYFGWGFFQNADVILDMMILGAISGVITTIIAVKFMQAKRKYKSHKRK